MEQGFLRSTIEEAYDDNTVGIFEYEDGVMAIIDISARVVGSTRRLEVYGTKGTAIIVSIRSARSRSSTKRQPGSCRSVARTLTKLALSFVGGLAAVNCCRLLLQLSPGTVGLKQCCPCARCIPDRSSRSSRAV